MARLDGQSIIRRPLVVARADIELDERSGRLAVGPAADGMNLHLEYDMLEEQELPERKVMEVLESGIADVDDPLASDLVAETLSS